MLIECFYRTTSTKTGEEVLCQTELLKMKCKKKFHKGVMPVRIGLTVVIAIIATVEQSQQ